MINPESVTLHEPEINNSISQKIFAINYDNVQQRVQAILQASSRLILIMRCVPLKLLLSLLCNLP